MSKRAKLLKFLEDNYTVVQGKYGEDIVVFDTLDHLHYELMEGKMGGFIRNELNWRCDYDMEDLRIKLADGRGRSVRPVHFGLLIKPVEPTDVCEASEVCEAVEQCEVTESCEVNEVCEPAEACENNEVYESVKKALSDMEYKDSIDKLYNRMTYVFKHYQYEDKITNYFNEVTNSNNAYLYWLTLYNKIRKEKFELELDNLTVKVIKTMNNKIVRDGNVFDYVDMILDEDFMDYRATLYHSVIKHIYEKGRCI